VLYATSMAWVLGYDTVYAHMDIKDDVMIGIRSTVLTLGERAVDLVVVCWWLVFFGWAVIYITYSVPAMSWVTFLVACLFQLLRCMIWNPDNDRKTLQYFQSQHWFGGMLALSCWYNVLRLMPPSG
jgi:4-hydroxybenzoate polyprenyltransferase